MNERLKELRKHLKLTQTEFGRKLGFARVSIAQMESGDMNITDKTSKDICREFKVNYLWLTQGNGDMFVDDETDILVAIDEIMSGDDDFYKNIIKMIVKLDHDDIKSIKKMAKEILKNKNGNDNE